MKDATPALVELLRSKRQFACVDLFTIVRRNGDTMRYCTGDIPVLWEAQIFTCYEAQLTGLRYRIVAGLEADEQTLTIAAERSLMLDGQPYLDAIREGALDGARIKRERAYFDGWGEFTGRPVLEPVGCITVFTGFVSSIESITRVQAELQVKSNVALLDVQMPRNVWQASCIHTLFDGGCGHDRQSYGEIGTVGVGSTAVDVAWDGATPAYYWNGSVRFTSGANANLTRAIKNSNGAFLVLSYPLPEIPAEGDTFVAWPGCEHTYEACGSKFSNQSNYRGFPFIPTAETAI